MNGLTRTINPTHFFWPAARYSRSTIRQLGSRGTIIQDKRPRTRPPAPDHLDPTGAVEKDAGVKSFDYPELGQPTTRRW